MRGRFPQPPRRRSVRGLARRHTSERTLPFDDLRPQTNTTASNRPEKSVRCCSRFDTCRQIVSSMYTCRRIGGPAAHFGAQPFEQRDALRGLRKEIDRTREVDQLQVLLPFDHDRRVRDLPREPHHFGVAPFAEDHHLPACRAHPFVGLLHAALAAVRPPGRWRRSPRCPFPGRRA